MVRKVKMMVTVTESEFDKASAAAHEALEAFRAANSRRDKATEDLHRLQCLAVFKYLTPGPDGEEWEIETECGRRAGHEGDHDERATVETVHDATFESLVNDRGRFGMEAARAGSEFDEAQEALAALECGDTTSSALGCCLRLGHDGDHVCPTHIEIVA
ncbi:hypothetical protein BSP239C_03825 [Brevibacterium sp. 239c]|nr:hypothetical protein BSP239C_03825 [Brevibacterium sp. 239c]